MIRALCFVLRRRSETQMIFWVLKCSTVIGALHHRLAHDVVANIHRSMAVHAPLGILAVRRIRHEEFSMGMHADAGQRERDRDEGVEELHFAFLLQFYFM